MYIYIYVWMEIISKRWKKSKSCFSYAQKFRVVIGKRKNLEKFCTFDWKQAHEKHSNTGSMETV